MAFHSTRFFIKEVHNGRNVWSANHRTVSADDVTEVLEQYRRHGGSLTIYSGTHGDPQGNFSGVDYADRSFAYEDRQNRLPGVRVINVSRVSINIADTIANATTDVMFAWCFSHASITGKSAYA
ncbi:MULTISPECIES: hypothetical protein [Massilia]|uniref:Uncharacterized protein n=2 Tax=Massilia TaxID=149698 RepID=A0ABY4A276_9BURK|nr:hypothetical protein [Massilia violaceinigra]NHZ39641.1 hypothetical protein [Massilia aquatica]UOD28865.1 hypothetical protein INH39_26010 [Massilia violaceinigra]